MRPSQIRNYRTQFGWRRHTPLHLMDIELLGGSFEKGASLAWKGSAGLACRPFRYFGTNLARPKRRKKQEWGRQKEGKEKKRKKKKKKKNIRASRSWLHVSVRTRTGQAGPTDDYALKVPACSSAFLLRSSETLFSNTSGPRLQLLMGEQRVAVVKDKTAQSRQQQWHVSDSANCPTGLLTPSCDSCHYHARQHAKHLSPKKKTHLTAHRRIMKRAKRYDRLASGL